MRNERFTGARVLVTGSSRGIGLALAHAFHAEGADVVLSARSAERVAEAREVLDRSAGGRGAVHEAVFDVTDAAQVQAEVQRITATLGPIDVLVNNAGVQRRAPLLDMDVSQWREVIDVNLTGAFVVGQAVARGMVEVGAGKIVNICSVQTALVRPTTGPYAASKAGLAGLTRAMSAEWAPLGLQVNGLAPGYLATELNAALTADAAFTEWITKRTPARRWGELDDVTGPVLWLCSDEARFVNGQVLYVDGGITAVI